MFFSLFAILACIRFESSPILTMVHAGDLSNAPTVEGGSSPQIPLASPAETPSTSHQSSEEAIRIPPAQLPGKILPSVHLPEDEFILPPYLVRFEGGIALNVTSGEKMRSAGIGEWLDQDDSFNLQDRLALQVLMSEKIQWVGGGALKLSIEEREWKRPQTPYRLNLDRGFLAVWVNATSAEDAIEIQTPQEKFTARDAEFWISSKSGVTELYLIHGSLQDSKGTVTNIKKYMSYKQGVDGVSVLWDPEAYKVRIAGLFPHLMKLIEKGEADWKSDESKDTYATLRKKGWRKSLRR